MIRLYDYINSRGLNESENNLRKVVVYGGKFQPFHAGHYEIYEKLVKEFGKENVFISTCDLSDSKKKDKTYRVNHIFDFKEKVEIMTTMFKIPASQIFCAKRSPFLPTWREIPVSGSDYALILIAGEKDDDRFTDLKKDNVMKLERYNPDEELHSCLTHKYYYHVGNDKVKLSATQVREFFRNEKDDEKKREYFKMIYKGWNERIYNLVNKRINYIFESYDNDVEKIFEGGVCGHIQHLYNDLSLTWSDIEEIIKLGFSNKLESSVEKVDGQPLAMTYKDGKFLFAYSSYPKTIDELELEMYRDLPKKVYRENCERLERAFRSIPNFERYFDGNKLLQMEVISSKMPNMIKYGRDALIFHYVVEYDENGNAIDKSREVAQEIADKIDNVPSSKDEKIKIIGPPRLKLKDIDFTDVQNRTLEAMKSLYKPLRKDTTIEDWLYWNGGEFLKTKGIKLPDSSVRIIMRKWLGLNKTHQFTERNYKDRDTLNKLIELDKKEGPEYINGVYNKYKVFITNISIDILRGLKSLVVANADEGKSAMLRVLKDAITELTKTDEINTVGKLRYALERLNTIGLDNLIPSEGIIFNYKDKVYKITGMFADYIALSNVIRDKMKNNEYVF